MLSLQDVVAQLIATPTCSLLPPAGSPTIPQGLELPSDLQAFYKAAGGARLFEGMDYAFSIAGPTELLATNSRVLGAKYDSDISDCWFTIANDDNGDYLSIDLNPQRLGRCYDSFHETHGVVGSTPVIALSFTDLLLRLLESRGNHPYWLSNGFVSLGDAYDNLT
jgi:antitoxin YokJ